MTQADLENSYIWQRLGFGKNRCMKVLPPVWLFGGLIPSRTLLSFYTMQ
ncbi:Uncharacterised protein [Mannheimia haemolytica]|uniref:Uncharacterized protein n=1 Tax=Mannheimia haemolytica TaxID=75985 RepID=A0A378MYT0_MANHA|nr:Uncharacterised protein [Mannheimia haemolytica]